MPTCKKCFFSFPNYFLIAGKKRNLKNRKYCLSCSPFGKHNTSQLEKPKQTDLICLNCNKPFLYKRGTRLTESKCYTCLSKIKRTERKIKAVEYKGGKCQVCDYNRCLDALGFHHLNPNEKEFQISGNYCRSWEIIKKELDKCILLCVRCHAEVHEGCLKLDKIK